MTTLSWKLSGRKPDRPNPYPYPLKILSAVTTRAATNATRKRINSRENCIRLCLKHPEPTSSPPKSPRFSDCPNRVLPHYRSFSFSWPWLAVQIDRCPSLPHLQHLIRPRDKVSRHWSHFSCSHSGHLILSSVAITPHQTIFLERAAAVKS